MREEYIHNDFLDTAQWLITKSCLKRNYGCVIVKNGKIISAGKTITPSKVKSCHELGYCHRDKVGGVSNEYNYCLTCHAEQEALIYSNLIDLEGSTLYLVCLDYKTGNVYSNAYPCNICRKMISRAKIKQIVIRTSTTNYFIEKVEDWDLQTLKFQH